MSPLLITTPEELRLHLAMPILPKGDYHAAVWHEGKDGETTLRFLLLPEFNDTELAKKYNMVRNGYEKRGVYCLLVSATIIIELPRVRYSGDLEEGIPAEPGEKRTKSVVIMPDFLLPYRQLTVVLVMILLYCAAFIPKCRNFHAARKSDQVLSMLGKYLPKELWNTLYDLITTNLTMMRRARRAGLSRWWGQCGKTPQPIELLSKFPDHFTLSFLNEFLEHPNLSAPYTKSCIPNQPAQTLLNLDGESMPPQPQAP